MVITGILTVKGPVETGVNQQTGRYWQKTFCVINQTPESNYANLVAIEFLNNNVAYIDFLQVHEQIAVHCDVCSREYNGKYYTTVIGWKVVRQDGTELIAQPQQTLQAPAPVQHTQAPQASHPWTQQQPYAQPPQQRQPPPPQSPAFQPRTQATQAPQAPTLNGFGQALPQPPQVQQPQAYSNRPIGQYAYTQPPGQAIVHMGEHDDDDLPF